MTDRTDEKNLTTPCTHCGGTGKIRVRDDVAKFPIGAQVWWKGGGYGYEKRVPGTVVAHSSTGKTVRMRFMRKDANGNDWYEMVSSVRPSSLVLQS